MVTDGIMTAVQMMIDSFKNEDEIGAGNMIMEMLGDYDEDQWDDMNDEEKVDWIKNYVGEIKL